MTIQDLADKLQLDSTALQTWIDKNGLTIEDMLDSKTYQEAATADLKGALAVVNDAAPIVTTASTKTKAPKGGKLAAKKEASLSVKAQKAQQAQQVQGNVNSALQVQMQSIAADAATTLDGINAFTQAVGSRIGHEIAAMPMAIGQIALNTAEEDAPEMGVGFSQLDQIAADALASIG